MTEPTTLSRQSETQLIIRNILHRLEQLLDQRWPDLFHRALARSGMADGANVSLTRLDAMLLRVREQVPGITLELFSSLSLTDLGLVGYAAASADTVGSALDIVNNYHAMTSDRYRPVMETQAQATHIVPVASAAFSSETMDIAEDHLAGTWNALRQLLGPRAVPAEIELYLDYPAPSYRSLYEQIFGRNVHFEAGRTELVFPSSWLAFPVAMANPEQAELYSAVCERLLGPVDRETDTRAAVRTLLLTRTGRAMPGVEAAARALNLSTDQFRKRLWRQGCSYKSLVLEARMLLAKNYLEATSLGIQEIAYLLDYSHPGAFSRAFKKYYGLSPGASREAAVRRK